MLLFSLVLQDFCSFSLFSLVLETLQLNCLSRLLLPQSQSFLVQTSLNFLYVRSTTLAALLCHAHKKDKKSGTSNKIQRKPKMNKTMNQRVVFFIYAQKKCASDNFSSSFFIPLYEPFSNRFLQQRTTDGEREK